MPIYLIRHGQSEFNISDHSVRDPMIFDARLTEKGRKQAEETRKVVADLGIQHVMCSPLTRAIETAVTIFNDTLPISVNASHREMLMFSGDVGRPPEELAKEFPSLDFDHLDEHWWHNGSPNENGVPTEPAETFFQRVCEFDAVLEKSTTRPLAIVGHGNFFLQMTGRMPDNCEVIVYEIDPNRNWKMLPMQMPVTPVI